MIVSWRRAGALDYTGLVSLDQARDHASVDGTDDDALLGTYLTAAVGQAETFCRRPLLEGDYVASVEADRRMGPIALPYPPDATVTITAVEHRDSEGVVVVLDPADYETVDDGALWLRPPWGASWPGAMAENGATIRYTASYVDPAAPPAELTLAVLMMAAHRFTIRETVIVGTIQTETLHGFESLLWPYRDPRLF